MGLTAERLRLVLEREAAGGFNDRTVYGGLDRLLANWDEYASLPSPLRLPPLGYTSLPPGKRAKWVQRLLAHLKAPERGADPSSTPTGSPARKRRSPTSSRALPPAPRKATGPVGLDSPIAALKGVRGPTANRLGRLGVHKVRDLLYFFPHRHADYGRLVHVADLQPGADETVVANVWEATRKRLGGAEGTEAVLGDETGNVRVVWFNQPYVARQLRTNDRIVVSGRVVVYRGRPVFQNPEWEPFEGEDEDLVHTGRLVPIYPLTEGLYQRVVRRLVKEVVARFAPTMDDFLPPDIRAQAALIELSTAIRQAHYPDDEQQRERARRRLAFDELFMIQLALLQRRAAWKSLESTRQLVAEATLLDAFLTALPFALTGDQVSVRDDILHDIAQERPMSRLLQGDVGSGKTVVATIAMLTAAVCGCQSALMAPTEILAEQHFRTISRFLDLFGERGQGSLPGSRPITITLLTSGTRGAERQQAYEAIRSGRADIVVGTHALIQEGLDFACLGLAVIDEQHRFGVLHRQSLRRKGTAPHVLVMTATPIPRTLALTVYGDLDVSSIREMPPGRQRIETRYLPPDRRARAYAFVRAQVESGRQAFIVCPLIEESEAIDARAATVEYERLSGQVFPDLSLGLLHGRMPAAQKDEAMRRFRSGETQVLVSTSVVEVGIDVPNATVMLVEGADRFGLSQLHQFRGRVGRGEHKSYCLLLADSPSAEARERLSVMERTHDGFVLAEEDLRLRGPGEFFGVRQSGLPELRVARLTDIDLIQETRAQAQRILEHDPQLERPEHARLRVRAARMQDGAEVS